jgi:hypothetical protein
MNTTARVLTSGLRDYIHVSEQTANLLVNAGKEKWLVPRQDKVEAKGKGILKTFWLKSKTRVPLHGSSDPSDVEEEPTSQISQTTSESCGLSDVDIIDHENMLREMDEKLFEKSARPPVQTGVNARLVAWNCELLVKLLKQVVAQRKALQYTSQSQSNELAYLTQHLGKDKMVVDEVAEIISLPEFDENGCYDTEAAAELDTKVVFQIQEYVTIIASLYHDNPFHNFEHASHVTMSVCKLLSRIVAPKINRSATGDARKEQELLHDHTYGITSDPLTQFTVVLSAMIHDVDHRGIPNFVLIHEEKSLGDYYEGKSVAEQNSVDLAWNTLMADGFEELRNCIFATPTEMRRFRQLLINSVIATDIFDKELGTLRKKRWAKAFDDKNCMTTRDDINRKATIVIEHLIQASDVSHTMQHWQVYLVSSKLYSFSTV